MNKLNTFFIGCSLAMLMLGFVWAAALAIEFMPTWLRWLAGAIITLTFGSLFVMASDDENDDWY